MNPIANADIVILARYNRLVDAIEHFIADINESSTVGPGLFQEQDGNNGIYPTSLRLNRIDFVRDPNGYLQVDIALRIVSLDRSGDDPDGLGQDIPNDGQTGLGDIIGIGITCLFEINKDGKLIVVRGDPAVTPKIYENAVRQAVRKTPPIWEVLDLKSFFTFFGEEVKGQIVPFGLGDSESDTLLYTKIPNEEDYIDPYSSRVIALGIQTTESEFTMKIQCVKEWPYGVQAEDLLNGREIGILIGDGLISRFVLRRIDSQKIPTLSVESITVSNDKLLIDFKTKFSGKIIVFDFSWDKNIHVSLRPELEEREGGHKLFIELKEDYFNLTYEYESELLNLTSPGSPLGNLRIDSMHLRPFGIYFRVLSDLPVWREWPNGHFGIKELAFYEEQCPEYAWQGSKMTSQTLSYWVPPPVKNNCNGPYKIVYGSLFLCSWYVTGPNANDFQVQPYDLTTIKRMGEKPALFFFSYDGPINEDREAEFVLINNAEHTRLKLKHYALSEEIISDPPKVVLNHKHKLLTTCLYDKLPSMTSSSLITISSTDDRPFLVCDFKFIAPPGVSLSISHQESTLFLLERYNPKYFYPHLAKKREFNISVRSSTEGIHHAELHITLHNQTIVIPIEVNVTISEENENDQTLILSDEVNDPFIGICLPRGPLDIPANLLEKIETLLPPCPGTLQDIESPHLRLWSIQARTEGFGEFTVLQTADIDDQPTAIWRLSGDKPLSLLFSREVHTGKTESKTPPKISFHTQKGTMFLTSIFGSRLNSWRLSKPADFLAVVGKQWYATTEDGTFTSDSGNGQSFLLEDSFRLIAETRFGIVASDQSGLKLLDRKGVRRALRISVSGKEMREVGNNLKFAEQKEWFAFVQDDQLQLGYFNSDSGLVTIVSNLKISDIALDLVWVEDSLCLLSSKNIAVYQPTKNGKLHQTDMQQHSIRAIKMETCGSNLMITGANRSGITFTVNTNGKLGHSASLGEYGRLPKVVLTPGGRIITLGHDHREIVNWEMNPICPKIDKFRDLGFNIIDRRDIDR